MYIVIQFDITKCLKISSYSSFICTSSALNIIIVSVKVIFLLNIYMTYIMHKHCVVWYYSTLLLQSSEYILYFYISFIVFIP